MTGKPLTTADYPIVEQRPDLVESARGKPLAELSLEAVLRGDVTMADLRITAKALRQQAEIARSAERAALAGNFERASEMAAVPQAVIMEIYELLRPGRAGDKAELLAAAGRLRRDHAAEALAAFIEEAAEVYASRGLFKTRY